MDSLLNATISCSEFKLVSKILSCKELSKIFVISHKCGCLWFKRCLMVATYRKELEVIPKSTQQYRYNFKLPSLRNQKMIISCNHFPLSEFVKALFQCLKISRFDISETDLIQEYYLKHFLAIRQKIIQIMRIFWCFYDPM